MLRTSLTLALTLCLCLALLPLRGASQTLSIVVFVHPDVPAQNLDGPELRALFRTEIRYWDNGTRVAALNLPPDHPVRKEFDRVVLGFDPDEMTKFWIDRTVRGGARPPRSISSEQLVARVVPRLKGAIGYTTPQFVPPNARVVARVERGRVAHDPSRYWYAQRRPASRWGSLGLLWAGNGGRP